MIKRMVNLAKVEKLEEYLGIKYTTTEPTWKYMKIKGGRND